MDARKENVSNECKRQEESCLYTSTALFEWLKFLRVLKIVFVVAPIVLGAVATWPLFAKDADLKWLTGICAFLAALAPAVYKALDFDVSLDTVKDHANAFKILQDRFRQAWRVSAHGDFEAFEKTFADLMERMDAARASSLAVPERFFTKAKEKIEKGHYAFAVDAAPATPDA